jgi:hypothetical protein
MSFIIGEMVRQIQAMVVMFLRCGKVNKRLRIVTLQRYLIEGLAQTPFSMREIGPMIALLQVSRPPQDILRLEDFERQHHGQ